MSGIELPHRRSFSYSKLPQQLLKLTVLKLDGSSFDVQISRMATVSELKQAVEQVFSLLEEGEEKISWTHVWGHFCLCYEGSKLLNDKDPLRAFAIKDGDQLYFIRHLSINYSLSMKRDYRDHTSTHEQLKMSSVGEDIHEEDNENDEDYLDDSDDDQEGENHQDGNGEEAIIRRPEFKLSHFLKGCLSFSMSCCGRKTRLGSKNCLSNFGRTYLRVGTNMMRLQ